MSALEVQSPPSLTEAIDQQITLGEKDPSDIWARVVGLYGDDWLAEQLLAHASEIGSEIARQRLGTVRRGAITSLGSLARANGRPGLPPKREALLASLFVPKKGYIALGNAEEDDLREASDYRRRLAAGLFRWADWLDMLRAGLDEQGVKRVRDLKGPLPQLPDGSSTPELGA